MNKLLNMLLFFIGLLISLVAGVIISPFLAFYLLDMTLIEKLSRSICSESLNSEWCVYIFLLTPISILFLPLLFILYKKKYLYFLFILLIFHLGLIVGSYTFLNTISRM